MSHVIFSGTTISGVEEALGEDFRMGDEMMNEADQDICSDNVNASRKPHQPELDQNEPISTIFVLEQPTDLTQNPALAVEPLHDSANSGFSDFVYRDPDPPIVARNNDVQFSPNVMEALLGWCKLHGISPTLFLSTKQQARVVGRSSSGDFQNMNWEVLKPGARNNFQGFWNMRQIATGRKLFGTHMSEKVGAFRFSKTFCQVESKIDHFQMRNLLVQTSQRDAFYANKWQVMHVDPSDPIGSADTPSIAMDLTEGDIPDIRWRISTLAKSRDALFAGTFRGNIVYQPLYNSEPALVRGNVDSNRAINYINPTPNQSMALLAVNDGMLATLEYSRNETINRQFLRYDRIGDKFSTSMTTNLSNLEIPMAVNCSATSPDGRLCLLVGDFPHMILTDGRSGTKLVEAIPMCGCVCNKCSYPSALSCRTAALCNYHSGFSSFAVSWSQYDGFSVATGSEDGMIRLWDARMWRTVATWQGNSSIGSVCFASCGANGLKKGAFLLAAEASDVVHAINLANPAPIQHLSFFGDVGGVSVDDNGTVMVLNSDRDFGGLMVWNHQVNGSKNCLSAASSRISFASESVGRPQFSLSRIKDLSII